MSTITLPSGLSVTLDNGLYRIAKPGDEKAYVLKVHHSRLPEHMFKHYASEGVDPTDIAHDLAVMASDAYEAA